MISKVDNPPSRFQTTHIEWEDAPKSTLQVYADDSKSILSANNSPDVPFQYSVNPYRGCFHACTYCYARPSHEYLGFGSGTDFERRILVKHEAARLLERAFLRPSWKGDVVCFSGNTDCYQPIEHNLGITRQCLEVCLRYRNPVGIITKSTVILRDIDLLAKLHKQAHCRVIVSIPFLDAKIARAIEPSAPPPQRRIAVVKALADAGIPVGISLGPMIPGLNDRDIPMILKACHEAGARSAWIIPIRLVGPVANIFESRLREKLPEHADRVMQSIRRMRGHDLGGGGVGTRMQGKGEAWASTVQLFELWRSRLGMVGLPDVPVPSPFRVPGHGEQTKLFS
ncbi:MAG: radical SAM protein [Deltaproteobacteria bacterium]|nr:radical SAM protein [Deltaproteobacteria bacterium]